VKTEIYASIMLFSISVLNPFCNGKFHAESLIGEP